MTVNPTSVTPDLIRYMARAGTSPVPSQVLAKVKHHILDNIARLNTEINKVLNMSEVREQMRTQGLIVAPGSSEQFAALLKSDGARYSRIAREANVRLD